MTIAIVVHGGAGAWRLGEEGMQTAVSHCQRAAQAAYQLLQAGKSALDAVETAVNILEDSPLLDAGRGSFPNAAGDVEMDALIMDGRTLDIGALAAIQRVQHPISLARRVMSDSPHNFFAGDGASTFADSINFPRCAVEDLLVEAEAMSGAIGDTVGAVALDADGNLAVATSTGGTRDKQPGRVGDSPLVGSGGYADNWTAATSATGYGEALMKVVISKTTCDFVGSGLSAQAASDAAIKLLDERTGGEGGLITIDRRGNVGISFNTQAMPYAFVNGEGVEANGR